MNELWEIIRYVGRNVQEFAEYVSIPYYRIAEILYGQSVLTSDERKRIQNIYGDDIFLKSTKHNV